VKIISEPSATRYTAFKVIIEIIKSQHHRRYTANVQGQRSKVKVTE